MYRLLLVAILSCITISGFAKKKIALKDQARSLEFPIDAFIDNRIIELTIMEEIDEINVIIEGVSGQVIYSTKINAKRDVIVPIPFDVNNGYYNLVVFFNGQSLYGSFILE